MRSKLMKVALLGMVVCAAGQLQASVIGAWDFSNGTNTGAVAQWKTFTDADLFAGNSATDVIADGTNYTLQMTAGFNNANQQAGVVYTKDVMTQGYVSQAGVDTLLDVGSSTVGDDGVRVLDYTKDGTSDRILVFELAGLVEGQEYRIQSAGFIAVKNNTNGRNITMEVGDKSVEVFNQAYLDDITSTTLKHYGSYSEYIDFTADSSGTTNITFWTDESAVMGVSGLVVEVIPEPTTLGLLSMVSGALLFIRRRLAL